MSVDEATGEEGATGSEASEAGRPTEIIYNEKSEPLHDDGYELDPDNPSFYRERTQPILSPLPVSAEQHARSLALFERVLRPGLVAHVSRFLSPAAVGNAMRACKFFHRLFRARAVWRTVAIRDYPYFARLHGWDAHEFMRRPWPQNDCIRGYQPKPMYSQDQEAQPTDHPISAFAIGATLRFVYSMRARGRYNHEVLHSALVPLEEWLTKGFTMKLSEEASEMVGHCAKVTMACHRVNICPEGEPTPTQVRIKALADELEGTEFTLELELVNLVEKKRCLFASGTDECVTTWLHSSMERHHIRYGRYAFFTKDYGCNVYPRYRVSADTLGTVLKRFDDRDQYWKDHGQHSHYYMGSKDSLEVIDFDVAMTSDGLTVGPLNLMARCSDRPDEPAYIRLTKEEVCAWANCLHFDKMAADRRPTAPSSAPRIQEEDTPLPSIQPPTGWGSPCSEAANEPETTSQPSQLQLLATSDPPSNPEP